MNCSYQCIAEQGIDKQSICTYIDKNCPGQLFISLHYCFFQQSAVAFIIIFVILVVLVFFFLSTLTDNFLQPSLRSIYTKLGISETMAGLTFMAFGNGGPDVITAIIGSGRDDGQGALLPVGTLFGACLIATCLIVGMTIKVSLTKIEINGETVTKDIVFYLIASVTLLIYGVIGFINIGMSCIFFVYYMIYIGIVIKQQKELNEGQKVRVELNEQKKDQSPQQLDQIQHKREVNQSLVQEQNKNNFIIRSIKLVSNFILSGTVLPPNKQAYRKFKIVSGLLFLPIIFYISIASSLSYLLQAILFGIVLALFAALFLDFNCYQNIQILFSILSFIGSLIWMIIVVNITISFIQFLQLLTGTNKFFLGLTVLAFGNSIGDGFSYIGAAKHGMGKVAIAGIYGGQLFNLLIGMGIGMLVSSIRKGGKVQFRLFQRGINLSQNLQHSLGYIVIGCTLIHLVVSLIILKRQNFVFGNLLKQYGISFYGILLGILSIFSVLIDIFAYHKCN